MISKVIGDDVILNILFQSKTAFAVVANIAFVAKTMITSVRTNWTIPVTIIARIYFLKGTDEDSAP